MWNPVPILRKKRDKVCGIQTSIKFTQRGVVRKIFQFQNFHLLNFGKNSNAFSTKDKEKTFEKFYKTFASIESYLVKFVETLKRKSRTLKRLYKLFHTAHCLLLIAISCEYKNSCTCCGNTPADLRPGGAGVGGREDNFAPHQMTGYEDRQPLQTVFPHHEDDRFLSSANTPIHRIHLIRLILFICLTLSCLILLV